MYSHTIFRIIIDFKASLQPKYNDISNKSNQKRFNPSENICYVLVLMFLSQLFQYHIQ